MVQILDNMSSISAQFQLYMDRKAISPEGTFKTIYKRQSSHTVIGGTSMTGSNRKRAATFTTGSRQANRTSPPIKKMRSAGLDCLRVTRATATSEKRAAEVHASRAWP